MKPTGKQELGKTAAEYWPYFSGCLLFFFLMALITGYFFGSADLRAAAGNLSLLFVCFGVPFATLVLWNHFKIKEKNRLLLEASLLAFVVGFSIVLAANLWGSDSFKQWVSVSPNLAEFFAAILVITGLLCFFRIYSKTRNVKDAFVMSLSGVAIACLAYFFLAVIFILQMTIVNTIAIFSL